MSDMDNNEIRNQTSGMAIPRRSTPDAGIVALLAKNFGVKFEPHEPFFNTNLVDAIQSKVVGRVLRLDNSEDWSDGGREFEAALSHLKINLGSDVWVVIFPITEAYFDGPAEALELDPPYFKPDHPLIFRASLAHMKANFWNLGPLSNSEVVVFDERCDEMLMLNRDSKFAKIKRTPDE